MGGVFIKFLLISPVESSFIGDFNIEYGIAPPLGILYIARILEDKGDKVAVLDFSAEKFEEHKLMSELPSADVVGMTVASPSIDKSQRIIQLIKNFDSEIPTIIGGPHCTLFPKRSLEEVQADISIQGDGEKVILEIKKALNGKKSLSNVSGIFYRKRGGIKQGAKLQLIKDLDSIPFPARHLVKKYRYGMAWNPHIKKREFTTIIGGRGCPFNCRFCSRGSVNMHQYRTRSAKNILEELREIHNKGYKYVGFMDDSLLWNKKQAHMIFEKLIKEQIDLKFYITASRVDSADRELYNKMKKAGVIRIQFGLESGNQDVLDFYNKKTTVEKIRTAVNLSQDTRFITCGTFILGAPFETEEHFTSTVNFAKSLPLDSVSFLPLRYMVGANLWFNAVKDGKIFADEYVITADSKRGLGMFKEKELLEFCKRAERAFYYRPKYLINILKYSLQKNDFSLIQIFISIYMSYIKRHVNFLRINQENHRNSSRKAETIY